MSYGEMGGITGTLHGNPATVPCFIMPIKGQGRGGAKFRLSFPLTFVFFLELLRPNLLAPEPSELIVHSSSFLRPTMAREASQAQAGKPPKAGKRKVAEPSVASQTRGWRTTTVTEEQINLLSEAGYLPAPKRAPTRSTLVIGDGGPYSVRVPKPRDGERVCFFSHLLRGLGFPIHSFLQSLLFFAASSSTICPQNPFSTSPPS